MNYFVNGTNCRLEQGYSNDSPFSTSVNKTSREDGGSLTSVPKNELIFVFDLGFGFSKSSSTSPSNSLGLLILNTSFPDELFELLSDPLLLIGVDGSRARAEMEEGRGGNGGGTARGREGEAIEIDFDLRNEKKPRFSGEAATGGVEGESNRDNVGTDWAEDGLDD